MKSVRSVAMKVMPLLIAFVVLPGCRLFFSPDAEEAGSLVLFFRTASDSVTELSATSNDTFAELTPELTVERYEVDATGPGDGFSEVVEVGADASSVTLTRSGLKPGDWTIQVSAFGLVDGEGDEEEIGFGETTVTVRAGLTESATVTVTPLLGVDYTGGLDLTLAWPADFITEPRIASHIEGPTHAETKTVTDLDTLGTWEFDGDQAQIEIEETEIPAGYYKLFMELYEDDGDEVLVWAREFTLRIVAGRTTTGTHTLSEGDLTGGTLELTIISDMHNPFEVGIDGAQSEWTDADELELQAVVPDDDEEYSYEWYLSGEQIPGATDAALTHGPLPEGEYWLTLFVTRNGTALSSAGFGFSVVPAP